MRKVIIPTFVLLLLTAGSAFANGQIPVVPEPSTFLLLGGGLVGLGIFVWKKGKK